MATKYLRHNLEVKAERMRRNQAVKDTERGRHLDRRRSPLAILNLQKLRDVVYPNCRRVDEGEHVH